MKHVTCFVEIFPPFFLSGFLSHLNSQIYSFRFVFAGNPISSKSSEITKFSLSVLILIFLSRSSTISYLHTKVRFLIQIPLSLSARCSLSQIFFSSWTCSSDNIRVKCPLLNWNSDLTVFSLPHSRNFFYNYVKCVTPRMHCVLVYGFSDRNFTCKFVSDS